MGKIEPLDDVIRARLSERFGASVAAWLDALPAHAAALAERWAVTFALDDRGRPRVESGHTSVIFHTRRATGDPAVLKLTPEPALSREEGAALTAASTAEHAPLPRLFARDDEAGALLMEAIVPGTVGSERAHVGSAQAASEPARLAEASSLEPVARLLLGLRAVEAPAQLAPLSDRVAFVFALWERRLGASEDAQERVPVALLERGHELARSLADSHRGAPSFVHGDLHPGNVLDGGAARGLVAIDPRPCVGDPLFDAVDLALWGVADVNAAVDRITAIAARTGDDPQRLRAWCGALAALVAASLAMAPGASERRLALLLALAA
ncbi:MAG TPA: aminoglycoside phosphotransferase family protein [Conexibacter sp.]